MHPVSELFLRTLRGSHSIEVQVDAYRGADLVLANVPISGGSVQVDSASQVRRTLSLSVADPALDPGADPTAALAPFGSELAVRRGIRYPDGTIEWCPLGRFRIESARASASGSGVEVNGADRGAYVQDARFTSIKKSNRSNTIPAEIARLIGEVLPDVAVSDFTGSTASTPKRFWEEDRWGAIDELAKAIGAEVFFDPDGDAVIAPVPSIDDVAVWWADAGETGVLLEANLESTREGTYNGVRASGEGGDTAPVSAFVTDDDPTSPTYWGGGFGQKPRFYVSPLITTTAQATSAATAMLNRVRGLNRQLELDLVPNPALEAGDVIRVVFPDGATELHLVDGFEVSLATDGSMPVKTRSSAPLEE
jgi:hypothetical protein